MAYATLMTPTDVTLSNGAVVNITDASGNPVTPIWSFTFNGDFLAWGQIECYDVDTDEVAWYSYFPRQADWQQMIRYNGDTVRVQDFPMKNHGVSGRNYKWLLRQYQNDVTTNAPKCDIRYASGIIQSLPSGATGTTVEIEKQILKLRAPYYYTDSGTTLLIGCTYIEVGHERRMITAYNKSTGVITLASGFSSGTLTVGALYRLYTNYIESGYYDFKIRDIPAITETAVVQSGGNLHLSGTYDHPNNVNLESYKYQIYASGTDESYQSGQLASTFDDDVDNSHLPIGTGYSNDIIDRRIIVADTTSETTTPITQGRSGYITAYNADTGIATLDRPLTGSIEPDLYYSICMSYQVLIDESDRTYSYHLDYDSYVYFWDRQLSIVLETVSKEKQINRRTIQHKFASGNNTLPNGYQITQVKANQTITITPPSSSTGVNVYRRDADNPAWLHIGQLDGTSMFVDYTAGNNRTYEYRLQRYNSKAKDLTPITTEFMGWSITALTPMTALYQKNRNTYRAGETWRFVCGNQPSDITHNLGIVQHTGTSEYPTTSRANNKFENGTFTTNLLTVNCPGNQIVDNIERVERWKKFINGDNPFLLKSNKGDVWIVNVTGTPTRQYEESKNPILTTVSYEWVETDNVRHAYII